MARAERKNRKKAADTRSAALLVIYLYSGLLLQDLIHTD